MTLATAVLVSSIQTEGKVAGVCVFWLRPFLLVLTIANVQVFALQPVPSKHLYLGRSCLSFISFRDDVEPACAERPGGK